MTEGGASLPDEMEDREMIKVNSKEEAWKKVDELFPSDYMKDDYASERAGYDIYRTTSSTFDGHISDLNDRLEVTIGNKTVNVWIEDIKELARKELAMLTAQFYPLGA